MEKLVILHTNDMHSHLENWPRIRRYLIMKKKQLIKNGYEVLTFDAGDAIDRCHPLTEATNGQTNINLMNEVHYDAVTIGNNEGINNNHEHLNHLYDKANFPVVLDNLLDSKTGKIPRWAKRWELITTAKGTRIAIVGLTIPYQDGYSPLHWTAENVQTAVPPLLKALRGKYDILILISHLGVTEDRYIANNFPEFNIIIGGHSHILFPHGEQDNDTLLAATSKYGYYVGKINVQLKNHKIISDEASVIKTSILKKQPQDVKEIQSYINKGNQLLTNHKVANLSKPLTIHLYQSKPSSIVRVGLKAIMERTHTNTAMISSGMFLRGLPKGSVNMKQIHNILPHSIFPLRSVLSGLGLWLFIREVESNKNIVSELKPHGMGFRGKHFGRIYFSGIKYNPQTQTVYYHGCPIVPNKRYSIGLLDYYMFLPYFPILRILGNNHICHNKMFRHVFAEYLNNHFPIS